MSGFEIRTSWRPTFTVLVSPRMMRVAMILAVALVAAVSAAFASGRDTAPARVTACKNLVRTSGTLTVGTDNPAYPPWYGGSAGHGWKVSDPTSGKGYESAVAYAVAKQLGFKPAQVQWTYVPFNRSFAPASTRSG